MSAPIVSAILRVVLPYVFFGGLWIVLSDTALEAVITDPTTFAQLSIYKGWAFVLVTALLLAILLRGELRKRERTQTELEYRVAERTRELGEREAFVRALADEQKLVLENIQVGIAFTGDGRILRANPKFAELFGYDDPAQLVGAEPDMLFPDADEARRFLGAVRPKLAAGEAVDVEWDGARRDGSRFFGHTVARAIAAPGYTLAAIWMVEDVTERKAAEREIAELTTFLQDLIDHISNPIFYKGPDLRFRGCNRAYEQAFGVARENFVGKTVLELPYLPMADRQAYQAEDADVLSSGTTLSREAAMPFADGRAHQTLYSVSGFRDPDGSPSGLVGIIVDITPLKEAEAALRSANEEQAAIFEAANFGIALIQERVIRRCNRRLEEIFGYAAGELVGQPTRIWYGSEEAYLQGCDPTHLQTARGESHKREQRLRHKDGSLFWCRMMASALDPTDFSKGIVCVVEDVTEARAAAEALLEAKHAAEAADRLKSAFLATMSHELRTPLNSIIGFTGLVLQELPGPLNEEQKKQLGMVQGSARHLLALINDVLDISKIEAGELRVAAEPFDLAASIARVADMVRPLAEKKGLALSVNVADGVGAITGDVRRVEQILLNLLGNAIKFTESGAITLEAALVAGFQPEAAVAPVPAVRLSVSDTGMGIKPDDMALLFSPFRQVDSTLSRNHEGTGLGLAICRRLAALMGGIIEAESRWGEGSVFAVTLPMNPHAERELS